MVAPVSRLALHVKARECPPQDLGVVVERLAEHPCGEWAARNPEALARTVEALDTRWVLGLDLTPGEKMCLLALWSQAVWLPQYGSDDFRVPPTDRAAIARMLNTTRGTVEGWLRALRRAGWIRSDKGMQPGALILQRCEAMAPPEPRSTGHVYLVSFSDGRLKAGLSWDPKTRVQQHAMDARRGGLSTADSWISQPLTDVARTEKVLLARLERNGAARLGKTREYFTGLSFSRAVVLAEAICGRAS
jgi:hypothetical protein